VLHPGNYKWIAIAAGVKHKAVKSITSLRLAATSSAVFHKKTREMEN
jgi:ribosomal protein L30/L7E